MLTGELSDFLYLMDKPQLIGYFRAVFIIIHLQHFNSIVSHSHIIFSIHQIFNCPKTRILTDSF